MIDDEKTISDNKSIKSKYISNKNNTNNNFLSTKSMINLLQEQEDNKKTNTKEEIKGKELEKKILKKKTSKNKYNDVLSEYYESNKNSKKYFF